MHRQSQVALPVAGHAPQRQAFGDVEAGVGIEACQGRRDAAFAAAGRSPGAVAFTARQRQANDPAPDGVVGAEHAGGHLAVQRQAVDVSVEARIGAPAPYGANTARILFAAQGKGTSGHQVASRQQLRLEVNVACPVSVAGPASEVPQAGRRLRFAAHGVPDDGDLRTRLTG